MRLSLLFILLLGGAPVNAATVTLDFEEFEFDFVSSFESQGYRLTSFGQPLVTGVEVAGSGLWIGTGDGPYSIRSVADETFSLVSWDLLHTASGPLDVAVTGNLSGGGTIATTFTATETPATYFFSADWQALVSVEFSSGGLVALDNVSISVVPIPAAVWLFGSGLAGLGWMRRRQRA